MEKVEKRSSTRQLKGKDIESNRPIDDSIPNVVLKRNLYACVYVYACFAGIILQLGICA